MRTALRLLAVLALSLTACDESESPVEPLNQCVRANEYTITLAEGTPNVSEAIGSLASRHLFLVLRTYSHVPSFVARMTPQTAMRLAGQGVVSRVDHTSCYNGPLDLR